MSRAPHFGVAVLVLGAFSASAKPASLSLAWSTPPDADCPTDTAVVSQVRELRGTLELAPTTGPAEVSATARVSLDAESQRWVAEVDTRSAERVGHRRLEADSCGQAAEVVAVVLSLALAEREEVARATPPPPFVEPPSRPVALTVSAQATGRAGVWPRAQPGFGGALGVRWWRWHLELAAFSGLGQQVAASGRSANVSTPLIGDLSLCVAAVQYGRLELSPCASVSAAWLRATGVGVDTPLTGSAPWLSIAAGAALRVRVWGTLWVVVQGAVGPALLRPQLAFEDTGTLYRVPTVTGRGSGGLELRF